MNGEQLEAALNAADTCVGYVRLDDDMEEICIDGTYSLATLLDAINGL